MGSLNSRTDGHVDGFVGSYLNGWAAGRGHDEPCLVEVIDENGTHVGAGLATWRRDDAAADRYGASDVGFRIPVVCARGQRLHVLADGVELRGSPIAVSLDGFDGFCRVRGDVAVGWVSRRSSGTAPVGIVLRLAGGDVVGEAIAECGTGAGGTGAGDPCFQPYRFEIPLGAACLGRAEFVVDVHADGVWVCAAVGRLVLTGALDRLEAGHCAGWLRCADAPGRALELVVYRDDVPVGSGLCALPREDDPNVASRGFSIALEPAAEDRLHRYAFRLRDSAAELLGGPYLAGSRVAFLAVAQALPLLDRSAQDGAAALLQDLVRDRMGALRGGAQFCRIPAPAMARVQPGRRIDVVVPVPVWIGGPHITASRLRAALDELAAGDRLVIVAEMPKDADADAMAAADGLFAAFAPSERVVLLRDAGGSGVVDLANRGLDLCSDGDVLLLRAGVLLQAGALGALRAALHASADIATVSAMTHGPVTGDAALFNYPCPGPPGGMPAALDDITPAGLAAVALQVNAGLAVDVPGVPASAGGAPCVLLRREVLDRLGRLDAAFGGAAIVAFCAHARDLGFRHVVASDVVVECHDAAPAPAVRKPSGRKQSARTQPVRTHTARDQSVAVVEAAFPEHRPVMDAWRRGDALRAGRWRIDMHRLAASRAAGQRFVLCVGDWIEGGLHLAAADLGDRMPLRLRRDDDGMMQVSCGQPRVQAAFAPDEHAPLVALLQAAGIDSACFHQMLGFSIEPLFDAVYYAAEYPDVVVDLADGGMDPDAQLMRHYCLRGWREGRNPNARFDTVTYLLANADVAGAGINPYAHYLFHGAAEKREAAPALSPSVQTAQLLGAAVVDWVALVRPHLDADHYRAALLSSSGDPMVDALWIGQTDLAAHFAYRGWREGLSPNADFPMQRWLQDHPDCLRLAVNPLVHAEEIRRNPQGAAFGGDTSRSWAEAFCALSGLALDVGQALAVRAAFDAAFYQRRHADVAAAGVDPLAHYLAEGWKEGRNPNAGFDTAYYIAANPDVAASGLHPFVHYVLQGCGEGRRPQRPGGHRRRTIDAARAPDRRTHDYDPTDTDFADSFAILADIRAVLLASTEVVVALSHDCYVRSVGGTQIVIADEQALYNARGAAYLQLSPTVPRLNLAPVEAEVDFTVVLDGVRLGDLRAIDLLRLLATVRGELGHLTLVVHSLLGFNAAAVMDLRQVCAPDAAYFWLHDYSSLCPGFNLLRNDVAFCNAPPVGSLACRVCVYGAGRAAYLAEIEAIFAACDFTVLAPSDCARTLFLGRSTLPRAAVRVHAHWQLVDAPVSALAQADDVGARELGGPLTVAFIGYPTAPKGWPIFAGLVERFGADPRYRFLHFVGEAMEPVANLERVHTAVTAADRMVTVDLLRAHDVDVVLVLSTWPETFSFVTFEAMVAGAAVICLPDSGNVAAVVRRTGRGWVFESEDRLVAGFADGTIGDLVADRRAGPRQAVGVVPVGTTATLTPAARLVAPPLVVPSLVTPGVVA